ncbi:hypothetical protein EOK75_00900 [Pseudorhodobacter turbinis]|uniref:Biotin/lipoyl-binding protein n=1 Tax=Pseudorhodobacter turbinis TaxID=2500533 RepID=A0A4P8EDQ9_9RHOB|nr:hypothetical protein [Pseudorhodobacter turbinis]QCO54505.1 hypothetical protein EOK75_00900 [Pseudorhodobacter turbinis]
MRIFPFITAILVSITLFLLVFQRENLPAFVSGTDAPQTETRPDAPVDAPPESLGDAHQSVLVQRRTAQPVDSMILARGQTEAARQVIAKSETSGLIVSEPMRRGAYVRQGQALCVLDTGPGEAQLMEAEARKLEAESRLPEAQARLIEARALLTEAEINARAASKLSEGGFASEARVAATTAAVESARAGINAAQSGVTSATSGIRAAEPPSTSPAVRFRG